MGARHCMQSLKKDGACIFVHKNLKFLNINLHKCCNDQDIEGCAVKL